MSLGYCENWKKKDENVTDERRYLLGLNLHAETVFNTSQ